MSSVFVIRSDGTFGEETDMVYTSDDGTDYLNLFKMQKIVEGYLEGVPLKREGGKFNAYVNDEGAMTGKAPNALGSSVLRYLGFYTEEFAMGIVLGNVIITSSDDDGLNSNTVEALNVVCRWFAQHDRLSLSPELTDAQRDCLFNKTDFKHGRDEDYEDEEEEEKDEPTPSTSEEEEEEEGEIKEPNSKAARHSPPPRP